jgi:hypothetical protein
VQVSELFKSLEPGNRRSKYFRRHYGDTDLYCDGHVQTGDGVRISVCIYYHYAEADAMDGFGNPEMEQIWWAQPFQVQRTKLGADTRKLVEEDTALPQMPKKGVGSLVRCRDCGGSWAEGVVTQVRGDVVHVRRHGEDEGEVWGEIGRVGSSSDDDDGDDDH